MGGCTDYIEDGLNRCKNWRWWLHKANVKIWLKDVVTIHLSFTCLFSKVSTDRPNCLLCTKILVSIVFMKPLMDRHHHNLCSHEGTHDCHYWRYQMELILEANITLQTLENLGMWDWDISRLYCDVVMFGLSCTSLLTFLVCNEFSSSSLCLSLLLYRIQKNTEL